MSTSALIGRSPMARSRRLQPLRRRAVLDAAHQPEAEGRAERRRDRRSRACTFTGQRPSPATGSTGSLDQRAEAGGGEVARDAGDAERVRPVGRHRHVDHRIVEAGVGGVGRADRRVLGQIDDAVVVVGEAQLALRQQHAVRFDAADDALLEVDAGAGNMRARRREHADHAGARIRRPAHHLDREPSPGSTTQTRSRSAFGCFSAETTRATLNGANCLAGIAARPRPRARSWSASRRSRRARGRLEVLLEPGEGELHDAQPSGRGSAGRAGGSRSGRASARRRRRRRAGPACRTSAWRCGRCPCPRRSPGTCRDRGRRRG